MNPYVPKLSTIKTLMCDQAISPPPPISSCHHTVKYSETDSRHCLLSCVNISDAFLAVDPSWKQTTP